MKKFIIIFTIIIILVLAGFFLAQTFDKEYSSQDPIVEDNQGEVQDEPEEVVDETKTVIAQSVEGNDITAYHYGSGDTRLVLIGGIHGGYEWNTVLLGYEIMDYFEENPEVIPENVRVSVIPVLNPDGLNETVGKTGRFSVSDVPDDEDLVVAGRFNANEVDLNRNFDCDWEPVGTWRSRDVDAGSEPFSEPESAGLKSFIEEINPSAVVMYNSAADGVFASNCHGGVLDEAAEILNAYADASGYQAYEEFDFYEITGDAVNWLAKEGVPAFSVLLKNHQDIDWDENKKGIEALLEYYKD